MIDVRFCGNTGLRGPRVPRTGQSSRDAEDWFRDWVRDKLVGPPLSLAGQIPQEEMVRIGLCGVYLPDPRGPLGLYPLEVRAWADGSPLPDGFQVRPLQLRDALSVLAEELTAEG
jgi:hypothetical protein